MSADVIGRVLRHGQSLVPKSPCHTWILGYHLVEGHTGLAIDLPQNRFVEHLRVLSERTTVISLRDLIRDLRARSALRNGLPSAGEDPTKTAGRPRVVLTFDDAFLNFYEVILPLLTERALPASVFVPPGFVNGDGNHPLYRTRFRDVRAMSWDQLRETADAGIEIGSHTYRHTNLTRISAPDLLNELKRSQDEIERRLGVRPVCVCYPEGFVSAAVVKTAARFYEAGVVSGGRPVRLVGPLRSPGVDDLMRLPRLPVLTGMSSHDLAGLLEQSVALKEWAAGGVRRLRARMVTRG